MKTKLVNLHFELIVEVEDDATREEIIEQVRTEDLPEAIEDRDFPDNNVISVMDYNGEHDSPAFTAILAKNQLARWLKNTPATFEPQIECLRDIEKVIGTANQPSVDSIINSEMNV